MPRATDSRHSNKEANSKSIDRPNAVIPISRALDQSLEVFSPPLCYKLEQAEGDGRVSRKKRQLGSTACPSSASKFSLSRCDRAVHNAGIHSGLCKSVVGHRRRWVTPRRDKDCSPKFSPSFSPASVLCEGSWPYKYGTVSCTFATGAEILYRSLTGLIVTSVLLVRLLTTLRPPQHRTLYHDHGRYRGQASH